MPQHLTIGQLGENIAGEYVSRYCRILHKNWKYGRKEIDIIAENNGVIYFIEVKTRSSDQFGWPEESVNYQKQEHIQLAAEAYLFQNDLTPSTIRFDIISIILNKESYELMHFKDVF
ncbi:YraN family protein [Chitinophaga silvatica]|uniref:UPF0102 protein DVR12_24895 n=2 Tax=Chitinophaga silvatica TaxID=2282649 RepID=A0A3E1Y3D5_9BACT|nr:YraN family protein [Chitinophaga silvatica]